MKVIFLIAPFIDTAAVESHAALIFELDGFMVI
jgi:hypothetical protein